MKVRAYRPGDFDHLVGRERDSFGEDAYQHTKLLCENEITFTFENDGIPVAIVGCQIVQSSNGNKPNGTAQCWTLIGDEVRGNGLKLTKIVRAMIDDFASANKIGRMQAVIKTEIEENVKWIKLLGFKFESNLLKAGPGGTDLAMYVRFYE